mgnify:CR=1 FL=1
MCMDDAVRDAQERMSVRLCDVPAPGPSPTCSLLPLCIQTQPTQPYTCYKTVICRQACLGALCRAGET